MQALDGVDGVDTETHINRKEIFKRTNMRTCFNCNGKGEVVWCEDEPLDTCAVCEGTGECGG